MKNFSLFIIVGLIIIGGVFFAISKNSPQKKSFPVETSESLETEEYIAQEKKEFVEQGNHSESSEGFVRYVPYSKSAFDADQNKKRVYFFHASWCPTCKAANEEFTNMQDQIPEDVVLFKTDYDTERELKTQYAITYQHTFVYVDKDGKEIQKWNGGALEELIVHTK